MPTSSSSATNQGTQSTTETSWSRIGINAVAAAHVCKGQSPGKTANGTDSASRQCRFPYVETDFATD